MNWSVRVSLHTSHEYNDDGEDSDEPYSYRGTTSASLEDIRVAVGEWKGDFYYSREEIPCNFQPTIGQPIYIVIVHYDTGDTFGSDGRIEAAAAFETDENAREFARVLEANADDDGFERIEFENVSVYPGSWKGYFEHVNYVETRMLILER